MSAGDYTLISDSIVEYVERTGDIPRTVGVAPVFLLSELERRTALRIDSLTALSHAQQSRGLLVGALDAEERRLRLRLLQRMVHNTIEEVSSP